MKTVRWGILGTGFIANKFAQAVLNADGGKLVAVASRNIETANAFADKYNIEKCFSSYEAMAEFDGIDAVYIALPHTYHPIYAKYFMNAGKHVLSEKPICANAKQLAELQQIQKEKNVYLMEALWTRFLPAIQKLKQMLDDGIIGDVLETSADFCYNQDDRTHHVFKRQYAGGALLDVGIYGLNFASIILGDDVADIQSAIYEKDGIDERTNVLLRYKNGAIARFSAAITLQKPEDGYVYGTDGYIHVPHFYTASEFTVVTESGSKTYHFPYKGNGFEEEIEECNRCIAEGKTQSGIMPLTQSSTMLQIMDRIRQQAGIVYDMD